MDNKNFTMSVKYLPRRSQGILEERFMADLEYEWLVLNKFNNAMILKEWKAGSISLNIPMDRFKVIRTRYYSV